MLIWNANQRVNNKKRDLTTCYPVDENKPWKLKAGNLEKSSPFTAPNCFSTLSISAWYLASTSGVASTSLPPADLQRLTPMYKKCTWQKYQMLQHWTSSCDCRSAVITESLRQTYLLFWAYSLTFSTNSCWIGSLVVAALYVTGVTDRCLCFVITWRQATSNALREIIFCQQTSSSFFI